MLFILTKKDGKISLDSNFKEYTQRMKDGTYFIEIRKKKRSEAQNRALHLYFRMLAEELNDAGFDMKKVLRQEVDIPWTPELIKNNLWRPIQESRIGVKSTRSLKTGDIDTVYEIINKVIAERTGISIPFPSKELADQYN